MSEQEEESTFKDNDTYYSDNKDVCDCSACRGESSLRSFAQNATYESDVDSDDLKTDEVWPESIGQDIVYSLPSVIIDEKMIQSPTTNYCAVCLEEFVLHQILPQTPCEHVFHRRCLITALDFRLSCPICRHDLFGINDVNDTEN